MRAAPRAGLIPAVTNLADILQQRFGHAEFRPHQQAACEAVVAGHDALLVMPTGAGKSLCYQLPGVARGGSTLVVSPLISLMEDQVAKLAASGFAAARIHSGRPRLESRQACIDWAEGKLDFLFIAPERLRVPGFVQWLAKRTPGLVAIDEAHCISHWGHDFRPDYRLLGQRLGQLRGAGAARTPVIALTATATPRVQKDIIDQLGMPDARRLIHGFRRTNLAVEVVELKPSQRAESARALLCNPDSRPAIVYAPSRKECEALSATLSAAAPCLPYHAGLDADTRDRAQAAFLAGEVQVIVATIAFGMGIDKHDVRTVIHAALPASVEGYYQEIGRAGRDGKPSRAVLMYGFNDRRLHEFFLERDYPPVKEMTRLFRALGKGGADINALAGDLDLEPMVLASRLDKLVGHGGAEVDAEGFFTRGNDGWQEGYAARVDHRRDQLDRMFAFAEGRSCRMQALVRHFGDQQDDGRACGKCDICAPDKCRIKCFAAPDARQMTCLRIIMRALAARDDVSTGKLHRDNFTESELARRDFEALLGALEQNGLVYTVNDEFEKDGETIRYRRASLTDAGRETGENLEGAVMLAVAVDRQESAVGNKSRKRALPLARAGSRPQETGARSASKGRTESAPNPELVAALKAWRKQQADKEGVRAFHVLSNKTLLAVAAARPGSEAALASVAGIGPRILARYAVPILRALGMGAES